MASIRMPTTSAKPSWRSEPSGLNRNEAKLLAVIIAAELIRPPVWPIARMMPSRRPALLRLLVQPRHQEDVVVDPDGDQENEQEIGHLPVEPLGAEQRDEQQVRRTQCEGVGQDHGRDQVDARQRITQRHDQDDENADRHDEPALDLVVVGERPDIGRLGIGAGDLGRHLDALVFAEIIV